MLNIKYYIILMNIIKLITYIFIPFVKVKHFLKNTNYTSIYQSMHNDYEIINLNGEDLILGRKFPPVWD